VAYPGAESSFEIPVNVEIPALRIFQKNRTWAVLKERLPPHLTSRNSSSVLALGDVLDNSEQGWRCVSRPGNKRDIVPHPEQGAVFPPVALFYLEMLSPSLHKLCN
jgi:hypothetical protein